MTKLRTILQNDAFRPSDRLRLKQEIVAFLNDKDIHDHKPKVTSLNGNDAHMYFLKKMFTMDKKPD